MQRRPCTTLAVRIAAVLGSAICAQAGAIERISVATGGGQANSQSRYVAISGSGRYVVFNSDATNLVAGDTNDAADIFLRDRWLGTTTRVSTTAAGAQVAGGSFEPNISGDGMRIVFPSHGQLVPNGGWNNCYLVDRAAHTVQVLDLLPNGVPGTTCDGVSIDTSGRRVAIVSNDALEAGDANAYDVYVRDLVAGTTRRVSRTPVGGLTDGSNTDARISGDGSRVVFASNATNLVAGDSNSQPDVFLASADNSIPITRIDVGPANTQATPPVGIDYVPATNANGSLLAFSSKSPSLPDWGQFAESTLYLRIPSLDQTIALSIPDGNLAREGTNGEPDFDYTGRWLVFASTDLQFSGAEPGVYVIDLVEGLIALVSVGGNSGNVHMPRLSADGTGIVWYSLSTSQVPNDSNGTWDVFYADNPLWVDVPIFVDGFDA
jgi:Tol biopolymer transport system component